MKQSVNVNMRSFWKSLLIFFGVGLLLFGALWGLLFWYAFRSAQGVG